VGLPSSGPASLHALSLSANITKHLAPKKRPSKRQSAARLACRITAQLQQHCSGLSAQKIYSGAALQHAFSTEHDVIECIPVSLLENLWGVFLLVWQLFVKCFYFMRQLIQPWSLGASIHTRAFQVPSCCSGRPPSCLIRPTPSLDSVWFLRLGAPQSAIPPSYHNQHPLGPSMAS
jgi:hypothetical protein